MTEIVHQLAPYLPVAAALLFGLALVVCWLLLRFARGTRVRPAGLAEEPEVVGEAATDLIDLTSSRPSSPLKRSFALVRQTLTSLPSLGAEYRRPWVLVLGQSRAGKTTLLGRTGLGLRYGQPGPPPEAEQAGINWWAFDGGLVLDVFGDGVLRYDGRTSDRTEWRALLRMIRRSRPRRPVDAVLLTLPASELVDNRKPVAQRLAEASRRAAILHHKLAQAQTILGMSFPVYLLISRCDLLPGFATLPAALSPWRRQQMFGWSSPQTPRTTYSPSWVDRAFAELRDGLDGFQVEALARGRLTSRVDEFVLFPSRFEALLEPLRIYCNHLFSPKAGVEPLLFRGLYFCGASDPSYDSARPQEALTAPGVAPPGAVPDVVFVGDLLEHKIFPEAGLARPTERATFRARLRRGGLAAMSAAAVLWLALGLWPAEDSLSATTRSLAPPVDRITGVLEEVERDPSRVDPALPPPREMAQEVLAAASGVEDLRLRSARLPASWVSPLPERLRGSLRAALEEVVFPAVRASLIERAERLAAAALPARRSAGSPAAEAWRRDPQRCRGRPREGRRPFEIEDLTELRDFDRFTRDLEELERMIGRYRLFSAPARGQSLPERVRSLTAGWSGGALGAGALADGRDLVDELNVLTAELLSSELRPPSQEARRAWVHVLRGIEVPDFGYAEGGLDERLEARARQHTRSLFSALFAENPLDRQVFEASHGLASLTPLRPSAAAELAAYEELFCDLEWLKSDLALPEVQWMAAEQLALGSRFEEIRFRVHNSPFLGPDLALEIRDQARADFRRLRKVLLGHGTGYTGPLLEREQETFVLRQPVIEIAGALQLLLDEPFMQPQPGAVPLAEAPPGERLSWRSQPLAEALSLLRSYETYKGPDGNLARFLEENDLESLPRPLRGTEESVVRETLAGNVLDLVADSQELGPAPAGGTPEQLEASIRLQIKDLQAVEQDMLELMAALDDLDYHADSARLAQTLRGQQIDILAQLDRLLADLAPYRPRGGDFAWWDGAPPPAPEAFDAATADDLAAYLAAERQTVTRLSGEYAQPLLALFGDSLSRELEREAPQAAGWNRIAADLSDYANQAAGNPVSALEKLISGDLAEIDLYNCFDRLEARPTHSPATDFFRSETYALEQLLFERCSQLADEEGYRRYLELSEFFNVRLAGNFPFAAPSAVGSAEPQAIREFFERDFGRALYLVRNLPDPSPRFGDEREAVREFMERMEKVRRFFAVFLAPEAEVKVPVYDLDVRFRVMRGSEEGANQILRWQLLIEDQKIDLLRTRSDRPDTAKTPEEPVGRWVWDETPAPLRLAVGWASGSPFSPQAARPEERVEIDGKTLTFTYREPWALLRLLKDHPTPPEDFRNLRDPRPETLKLEVVTVADDEPGHRATATLFCRIVLLDPTDKKELALPDFPAFAPDFDTAGRRPAS